MKILHVIPSLDAKKGGPQAALLGFGPAQARAGLDVTVACMWANNADRILEEPLKKQGVNVVAFGPANGPLLRHPEMIHAMPGLVRNADVVHIHALWEEIQHQAARAAWRAKKPYVITPHGMLEPWSLSQKRLKKAVYMRLRLRRNLDRASAVHYITRSEESLVAPLRLKPPAIVEPIGLDWNEFDTAPIAGTFRARYPIVGNRRILLFLGRLHFKKGLDYLVRAFAAVKSDAVLVIAGPDSDGHEAEVRQWAAEAGVIDRILFTGMLYGSDRIAAFIDADLFILPSRQENFGIAVLEALAAGTPVILSDQVGVHREISEAGVGAVVSLGGPALAEQVNLWLDDDALRADAAKRAPDFARANYGWKEIVNRWEKHYNSLAMASG